MAILGFGGKARAERWISDVETLNAETDIVLKNVGMCLEDIGADGKGSAIDTLISAGTDMLNSAATMVTSFKSMVDVVQGIVGNILADITDNDSLLGGVASVLGRFGN